MSECEFPDMIASYIRRWCKEFVIELVKQLCQRLPKNFNLLQSMSSLSGSEYLESGKNYVLHIAKLFVIDAEIRTLNDFQWRYFISSIGHRHLTLLEWRQK